MISPSFGLKQELLKLLDNFQLAAGINSDTNLFLWGSFPGLAALYQHLTAFHPTLLTIPMWEKGREKLNTKQPEGSGMAEEVMLFPCSGRGQQSKSKRNYGPATSNVIFIVNLNMSFS